MLAKLDPFRFSLAVSFSEANAGHIEFFRIRLDARTDPWAMFNNVIRTCDGAGSGAFNGGRYSNAQTRRTD